MIQFKYTKLDESRKEIRLLTIMPGTFDDPLQLEIAHALLTPLERVSNPKRWSLDRLRSEVSRGWGVYESVGGKVIFSDHNRRENHWEYPDLDPETYEGPAFLEANIPRPDFEALSYAWGESTSTEDIRIIASFPSDQTGDTPSGSSRDEPRRLKVRKTLAEALLHLRDGHTPRVMWIDAVCINQDDDQERSRQVQLMGEIFTTARRVISWLGPEADNSFLATDALKTLGSNYVLTKDNYILSMPNYDTEAYLVDPSQPLPYNDITWTAISRFFSRSWFSRLWVVQEIQLGSPESLVRCGNDEIPWSSFQNAVAVLHDREVGHPVELYLFHPIRTCFDRSPETATPFELLLYDLGSRDCSDYRDRIYGLMNLAPSNVAKLIKVDYSLSLLETFRSAFLAMERSTRRLTCLRLCDNSQLATRGPNWSSWVPDWSLPNDFQDIIRLVPLDKGYRAASVSASQARAYGNELEVSAVFCSTVNKVEQLVVEGIEGLVHFLRDHIETGLCDTANPTKEPLLDVYLKTLLHHNYRERFRSTGSLSSLINTKAEVLRLLENDEAIYNDSLGSGFFTTLHWIDSRTDIGFLSTTTGYIGKSNRAVRSGDIVAVLLGCEVPVILRPLADDTYQLVSSAVIHGLMDGEALLGPLKPDWEIRIETQGISVPLYCNEESGTKTFEDPRLEEIPVPPEWEALEYTREPGDPFAACRFRNRTTGEEINSDPRLTPEALKKRGVEVKAIKIV